jgi:predicted CXXCH cytochrome family protein
VYQVPLLISLLASVGAPPEGPETPPTLRVLFPADRCVLNFGRFELIAKTEGPAPPLTVDGQPVEWGPYHPPVFSARLNLRPGPHRIAVGTTTLRVYVRGVADVPKRYAKWPELLSHPSGSDGWKNCAGCHEVSQVEERTAIGAPRTPAACSQCHTSQAFEAAHFHPARPLAACQNCHIPHGSTDRHLLRAPAKTLCTTCHD